MLKLLPGKAFGTFGHYLHTGKLKLDHMERYLTHLTILEAVRVKLYWEMSLQNNPQPSCILDYFMFVLLYSVSPRALHSNHEARQGNKIRLIGGFPL